LGAQVRSGVQVALVREWFLLLASVDRPSNCILFSLGCSCHCRQHPIHHYAMMEVNRSTCHPKASRYRTGPLRDGLVSDAYYADVFHDGVVAATNHTQASRRRLPANRTTELTLIYLHLVKQIHEDFLSLSTGLNHTLIPRRNGSHRAPRAAIIITTCCQRDRERVGVWGHPVPMSHLSSQSPPTTARELTHRSG
jgi:hypothetical protein